MTEMLPLRVLPEPVVERLHDLADLGDPPLGAYLYCPDVAARRADLLRGALPGWAEIFYAVKANSFPPVLAALASSVDGFEVASEKEAELAAAAAASVGKQPRLVASGPGKSEPNLRGLIALGLELLNVESELELHRVARLTEAAAQTLRVTLRINPARVRLTDSLGMGGAATPFGIAEANVPRTVGTAATMPAIEVVGFHFHELCNNLDAEGHAAYVQWCLAWSAQTAAAHGLDLQVVDVGGGLGVTVDGHASFDLDLFARRLQDLRPPPGVRVALEPGRWLVDDCGYYAAEVTDVKETRGTSFAILRGGINHFLRPATYRTLHNFTVVPREEWPYGCPRPEVLDAPVTVVGELCTPEDVLVRDVKVDRLRAGDIVVFPRAGSYGWEVALQEFLGHPRADRVAVAADNGSAPAGSARRDDPRARAVDGDRRGDFLGSGRPPSAAIRPGRR
jgi:diaminopimelate decarboxylase